MASNIIVKTSRSTILDFLKTYRLSITSPSLAANYILTLPPNIINGTYLTTDGINSTFWSLPTSYKSIVSIIPFTYGATSNQIIASNMVSYISDPLSYFNTSSTNLTMTLPANQAFIIETSSYFYTSSVLDVTITMWHTLSNGPIIFQNGSTAVYMSPMTPAAEIYTKWLIPANVSSITYTFGYFSTTSNLLNVSDYMITIMSL